MSLAISRQVAPLQTFCINTDRQILSQLTTRLRLYGANCNDTALVMQAIQDTKVDMTIWPAICRSPTVKVGSWLTRRYR